MIIALILYLSKNGDSGGSVNTSFYFAGTIYIFAFITSSYKQLFNNLIMFGNTRKSLVFSSFIAYAALSIVISVISIVSILLDISFTAVSKVNSGFDILGILYEGNANIAAKFLWFLAFFILVSAFSMLFGSLAYKFGKAFIIIFWVGSGFLLMFLPAAYNPQNLVNALAAFFCVGSANGILLAPINFILAAAVLGAGSLLAARRQSQNA